MQARAIIEAACEVKQAGIDVHPEIMIPLVGHVAELKNQRKVVDDIAKDVFQQYGITVDYKVGTMIEVPRGALTADRIAREAEFFSFGTNDLTQTVFGISRDDAGKYLREYLDMRIWENDPFERLDQLGVGGLMELAVHRGRTTRPDLKIGICGEHGGEPTSIEFCHRVGLDYVSCSPYRVPAARLAGCPGRHPQQGKESVTRPRYWMQSGAGERFTGAKVRCADRIFRLACFQRLASE